MLVNIDYIRSSMYDFNKPVSIEYWEFVARDVKLNNEKMINVNVCKCLWMDIKINDNTAFHSKSSNKYSPYKKMYILTQDLIRFSEDLLNPQYSYYFQIT